MPETTLTVSDTIELPGSLDAQISAAETLEISDQGDYELAAELLAQLADARKTIENRRKELVGPVKKLTAKIDTAAREARQPIESAEGDLRRRMAAYLNEQEAIRQMAEAERAAADAQAGEISDPESLPEVAEPRVRTSGGAGVGARKRWTYEAEDRLELVKAIAAAKGDRQLELLRFVAFDGQEINAAVKSGTREIPGVRIYETNDVVVR